MIDIRDRISDILGVRIQEGKWEAYVDLLDREGKFTRKTMIAIIMASALALENLQKDVLALQSKVDELEKVKQDGNPPKKQQTSKPV